MIIPSHVMYLECAIQLGNYIIYGQCSFRYTEHGKSNKCQQILWMKFSRLRPHFALNCIDVTSFVDIFSWAAEIHKIHEKFCPLKTLAIQ